MRVLTSFPSINESKSFIPKPFKLFNKEKNAIKMGLHIILPEVVFVNIVEMKRFVSHILSLLIYNEFYDLSVYRNNGSFRAPNSIKSSIDPRRLLPLTQQDAEKNNLTDFFHDGPEDYLNWILLPSKNTIPLSFKDLNNFNFSNNFQKKQPVFIKNEDAIYNHLVELKILSPVFQISKIKNNYVHLHRLQPGYCNLCKRTHESENAWFVVWSTKNKFFVVIGCYRTKENQQIDLPSHLVGYCENYNEIAQEWFELAPEDQQSDEIREDIFKPKHFFEEIEEWKKISNFFNLQNSSLITFDDIKPFHNIFVVSGMGTGKTENLHEYLKNETISNPHLSILIVSSRRTLTAKLETNYKNLNFSVYWDHDGPLDEKRLIVQVESIQRIKVDLASFDVIVLDEAITILEQLDCKESNSLTKFRLLSFQILIALMRRSKNVFILDAYGSLALFSTIQSMVERPTQIFVNIYPVSEKKEVLFCKNENKAVEHLSQKLRNLNLESQIFIACEEKIFANVLLEYLKTIFPDFSYCLITGDTDGNKKVKIFHDVNKELNQNIIIYTGALCAGVSFVKPVESVYGFFKGNVLHGRNMLQMMGRARACESWVFGIPEFDQYSEDLPSWENIANLAFLSITSRPLLVCFKSLSNPISLSDFNEAYLATTLFNTSLLVETRHYLYQTLKRLLLRYGCKMLPIFQGLSKDDEFYEKFDEKKIEIRKKTKIETAVSLKKNFERDFDFEVLLKKSESGMSMSLEEKRFIEARQIVNFYNFEGPITEDFFYNFSNIFTRRLWSKVCYSLNNPFFEKPGSVAETEEVKKITSSHNFFGNIEKQAFLAHGKLFHRTLRAGRELIAVFGFDTLWTIYGKDTITLPQILKEKRIIIEQCLLKILSKQEGKVYTSNELWKVSNQALYKVFGIKLLKKKEKIAPKWPFNFHYVIENRQAKILKEILPCINQSKVKETNSPIVYIFGK